ncbi:unnamed protein product [Phytophthora fragariaefolia]|uniref:Unnamed protein product n=1 Tax=Phytophthora fragariaefolia TaxID=1490495 RepID=A0A9W6XHE6_9STRA|nr:unnamed protein product [Phytophthora fragariaefolia]
MASSPPSNAEDQRQITYENAATLMAGGASTLHHHVVSRMQVALGGRLPQVEVRFENVSISANVAVKDESQLQAELPTISNVIAQSARNVGTKRHVITKNILRNVSGVFMPGTMTLVLGQPGSGKSTLMRFLSGRFPAAKNLMFEGDVTFNGLSRETLLRRLPQVVAYVPQDDKHIPTLTVKETLEFAHACNGGDLSKNDEQHFSHGTPEENQSALDAERAMYKHHPDIISVSLVLRTARILWSVMPCCVVCLVESASA